MNKKILHYSLLIKIVLRTLSTAILFGLSLTQMPALIFITSVLICVTGLVCFVRTNYMNKSIKEIKAFLVIETLVILFNLFYMSLFSPLSVGVFDTLLTGSIFDLILDVVLFAFCVRKFKYTIIQSQEEKSTIKNIRRSKKAYVRPLENLEIR